MSSILGNGIYGYRDAARLIGIGENRVRAWFEGIEDHSAPVLESEYRNVSFHSKKISFFDLIETLVLARLREKKLSLQYLRKVRLALIEEFEGIPNPFCHKNILTDGKKVFIFIANQFDDDEILRELVSKQQAFPKILGPVLQKIDYDTESMLAKCWNIGDGVVVDPNRVFGTPVVEAAGIATSILYSAWKANECDIRAVAKWYGVSVTDVKRAIKFEKSVGGIAA